MKRETIRNTQQMRAEKQTISKTQMRQPKPSKQNTIMHTCAPNAQNLIIHEFKRSFKNEEEELNDTSSNQEKIHCFTQKLNSRNY